MYVSVINARKEKKGKFLLILFICFDRLLKGAFFREFSISTRRTDRLKLGKLLSLIGYSRNKKTVSNTVALIFREQHFLKW